MAINVFRSALKIAAQDNFRLFLAALTMKCSAKEMFWKTVHKLHKISSGIIFY